MKELRQLVNDYKYWIKYVFGENDEINKLKNKIKRMLSDTNHKSLSKKDNKFINELQELLK